MKKSKSILYLRTDIINQELIAGGSVAHTLGVIKGFLNKDIEVICASSCMIGQLEKIGLDVLKVLKNPKYLSFLRWRINCLLSNLFFTFQSLVLFKNRKIDFIYQRYSILNCTGVLLSKLKKVPFILEYNGSEVWVDKNWSPQGRFKLKYFVSVIERVNLKYSDKIIVVSDALKEELVERSIAANKILVNPNGVDANDFDPQKLISQRNFIRLSLGMEDKVVFGFIGTFSKWHGIPILETLIPKLINKYEDKIHFLLVGDGPLKQSLQRSFEKNKIENHVTFIGTVQQDKAKTYLSACDIFLCPSSPNDDGTKFFGSPTKLFEYMSMGKPVIASDLGQISKIVSPAFSLKSFKDKVGEKCGFLVDPDKAGGFVVASCRLIEMKKDFFDKLGSNARTIVIENYTWNKHVESILSFLG